jgi:hypothetical protein
VGKQCQVIVAVEVPSIEEFLRDLHLVHLLQTKINAILVLDKPMKREVLRPLISFNMVVILRLEFV